ncbi:MAG: MBL fold metallo-hydrolase [Alcanivoracaceae bacterium]|nr:MBL fold metallo-hydrolase [Alcanivoracaceae bacterium]
MPVITSYGAAQEVTGSCHLLELNGHRYLLDCGMHQGGDAVARLRKEKFGFDPRRIDAVILSHAHLDHSGLLPKLVRRGFRGPIYCTGPTRNLLAIMLEDAANIYLRDLEQTNLKHRRAGSKPVPQMYDMKDVLQALKQCVPFDYHVDVDIAEDLQLHFHDAGHILGSAMVELRCREADRQITLVFSGDIGNAESVLVREPEVPPRADLVLMESTYGNRDHRPLSETLVELEQVLKEARRDQGNVLMPAFAVGRTQELLFHLGCFWQTGKLEGWKVYLDSPMAIEVTRLYDQWLDQMDEGDQRALKHFRARSLEEFLPVLTLTPTVEDSIALNKIDHGAIIIAGSGMCNGGRIRHHFKHRIWQENTHVVFAGFQARGTLGRQLVDGAPWVRMFGQRYAVRAKIHTLGGFSAHAGRDGLLRWARAIGGQPAFRLVHGESEALKALAHELTIEGHQVSIAEPESPFEF